MNLEDKIKQAQDAISCFYEAWDGAVYISFSGGKDSTCFASYCTDNVSKYQGRICQYGPRIS